MTSSMIQKSVDTPRGRIIYWIAEHADPSAACVFFLHGLTADHTLFDWQTGYFSGSYTVIVWDAPAHGQSRPYRDFSYANGADDIRSILIAEKFETAIMVGQSMGGYFIQAFLAKYPDMVTAFIGIDTCPFGLKYYSRSDMWWLRQVEWMSRCYPHQILVDSIARSVSVRQRASRNMQAALKPYTKDELCRLMGLGYTRFTKENQDLDIHCPVLILVGEHDKTGKVRQYCQKWHESAGFPLHIIKNAAHNANVDNDAAVNSLIDGFIRQVLEDTKNERD